LKRFTYDLSLFHKLKVIVAEGRQVYMAAAKEGLTGGKGDDKLEKYLSVGMYSPFAELD